MMVRLMEPHRRTRVLAAATSPEALRGRYLASFQFSWATASFVALGLFTLLFAVGPALPWAVVAALALVAGLSVLWLEPRLPRAAVRASKRATPGAGSDRP